MHVWNYAFTSPHAFLECMQTPAILPFSNTNLNRNGWNFSVQKGSETGVLVYMCIVQRILHPVDYWNCTANFICCEFCHILPIAFFIARRQFFPTGKPLKATDLEEYACARQETESTAQKVVASYYTDICLLHITLDSWCRARDPKTHTNLM